MLERLKLHSRELMFSAPLFAIAVTGCGGGGGTEAPAPASTTTETVHEIEGAESTNNIEHFRVGTVESYALETDVWYYEYTDPKGRQHVCDLVTNARGGTQGVGLSCEILPSTTTTTSIPR